MTSRDATTKHGAHLTDRAAVLNQSQRKSVDLFDRLKARRGHHLLQGHRAWSPPGARCFPAGKLAQADLPVRFKRSPTGLHKEELASAEGKHPLQDSLGTANVCQQIADQNDVECAEPFGRELDK